MSYSSFYRNFYGRKNTPLENHDVEELRAIARNVGIRNFTQREGRRLRKDDLVQLIADHPRYKRTEHGKKYARKYQRTDREVTIFEYEDDAEDAVTTTIGERIKARAKRLGNVGPEWYANQLFTELSEVGEQRMPQLGELCFFLYGAAFPEDYPYYDQRPLTYVLDYKEDKLFGANLHYLNPSYRDAIAGSLINKYGATLPKKTLHSYFFSNIEGIYVLPPSAAEYASVAELITERFVDKYGKKVGSQMVWDSI